MSVWISSKKAIKFQMRILNLYIEKEQSKFTLQQLYRIASSVGILDEGGQKRIIIVMEQLDILRNLGDCWEIKMKLQEAIAYLEKLQGELLK